MSPASSLLSLSAADNHEPSRGIRLPVLLRRNRRCAWHERWWLTRHS